MSFATQMTNINLGTSDGMEGPFLSFKPRGSMKHGIGINGWMLNSKDDAGNKSVQDVTQIIASGLVLDLDTLKLGWEKDNPDGAPTRAWAPDLNLAAFARPTNETKTNDRQKVVSVWSELFGIRVGMQNGTAATWSQSTFAAFEALRTALNNEIMPSYQQSKLPVITITGYREEYNSSIPSLRVDRWVDRPAFMTASAPAPAINMAASQPAPAPAPAPTPAPAAQMDPAVAAAASAF